MYAELMLPAMKTVPKIVDIVRMLNFFIHHSAGIDAKLMALSSAENRSPVCDGFSPSWSCSWLATAGAMRRSVPTTDEKRTMRATRPVELGSVLSNGTRRPSRAWGISCSFVKGKSGSSPGPGMWCGERESNGFPASAEPELGEDGELVPVASGRDDSAVFDSVEVAEGN